MGQPHSKPTSSPPKKSNSAWLDSVVSARTRRGLRNSCGTPVSSNVAEIPPDNIFVPIAQDSILPQIPIGNHHPVPKKGVEDDDNRTMNTNKFYANTFLGDQNKPVWTHPYSVWWGKGWDDVGSLKTFGMCISHAEENDLAYGDGDPAKSYTNPLGKMSIVLSAKELDSQTYLTTDTHLPFSVNINLNVPTRPQEPKMTLPVVQGMSFVTAGYRNAMPIIQTGGKGWVDFSGPVSMGKSVKYRVQDMDGRNWLMYINPVPENYYDATRFFKLDPSTIVGPSGFKGTIQVAKNPLGSAGEALYDKACGSFVTECKLTAVVNDNRGTYTFHYSKVGTSPLLLFALPHHVQSLDACLQSQVTKLQLRTTTKGLATAILTDKLTCVEPALPTTMSFGPWLPSMASSTRIRFPPNVVALIAAVAERDLRRAMTEPTPQDSMYHAGKWLAKFATIVWVCQDVLSNDTLCLAGLAALKTELARWINNEQLHPLYYDDTWKGIVSKAGFGNHPDAEFGNTYYNDHHFHFGYFVYAAAVIGYLDAEWLQQGDHKAWTNMLVKDFAEADYDGRDYPWARSFDWWHGHSWAKGLFESAHGKDQESTSEDGFASFAVKMWGRVIGDGMMEKRAYFGTSPPLIHGIHMLPLAPPSALLRPRPFVKEEWDKLVVYMADKDKDKLKVVDAGWRGILYANLALLDARASFSFFRDGVSGFWDEGWIDGGASRSWYLVWAAGMMGA
ncbi:endo-1,3-beta glucanase [Pleosporales sp. CAS-2024a]